MRLTQEQIDAIRISANEVFGSGVQVWLFGSRVDEQRRGGDIDLLVRPAQSGIKPSLASKIRFLGKLEKRLGERKVDVIVEVPEDSRPIVQIAHETGVLL